MTRTARNLLAIALVVILAGGAVVLLRNTERVDRTHVVAYFENSNGIYAGDDVSIVGVPVGRIESIEPQPTSVKVSFWFNGKYNNFRFSCKHIQLYSNQCSRMYFSSISQCDN